METLQDLIAKICGLESYTDLQDDCTRLEQNWVALQEVISALCRILQIADTEGLPAAPHTHPTSEITYDGPALAAFINSASPNDIISSISDCLAQLKAVNLTIGYDPTSGVLTLFENGTAISTASVLPAFADTNTVDFSGLGTTVDPITADVVIDPLGDNQTIATLDGIYTAPQVIQTPATDPTQIQTPSNPNGAASAYNTTTGQCFNWDVTTGTWVEKVDIYVIGDNPTFDNGVLTYTYDLSNNITVQGNPITLPDTNTTIASNTLSISNGVLTNTIIDSEGNPYTDSVALPANNSTFTDNAIDVGFGTTTIGEHIAGDGTIAPATTPNTGSEDHPLNPTWQNIVHEDGSKTCVPKCIEPDLLNNIGDTYQVPCEGIRIDLNSNDAPLPPGAFYEIKSVNDPGNNWVITQVGVNLFEARPRDGDCDEILQDSFETQINPGNGSAPSNCATEILIFMPEPTGTIRAIKTVNKTQAATGDFLIFTLTICNDGTATVPGPLTTISYDDQLPAGLTYVSDDSATNPDITLTPNGQLLEGTVVDLAPGDCKSVDVTVQVTDPNGWEFKANFLHAIGDGGDGPGSAEAYDFVVINEIEEALSTNINDDSDPTNTIFSATFTKDPSGQLVATGTDARFEIKGYDNQGNWNVLANFTGVLGPVSGFTETTGSGAAPFLSGTVDNGAANTYALNTEAYMAANNWTRQDYSKLRMCTYTECEGIESTNSDNFSDFMPECKMDFVFPLNNNPSNNYISTCGEPFSALATCNRTSLYGLREVINGGGNGIISPNGDDTYWGSSTTSGTLRPEPQSQTCDEHTYWEAPQEPLVASNVWCVERAGAFMGPEYALMSGNYDFDGQYYFSAALFNHTFTGGSGAAVQAYYQNWHIASTTNGVYRNRTYKYVLNNCSQICFDNYKYQSTILDVTTDDTIINTYLGGSIQVNGSLNNQLQSPGSYHTATVAGGTLHNTQNLGPETAQNSVVLTNVCVDIPAGYVGSIFVETISKVKLPDGTVVDHINIQEIVLY